MRRQACTSSPRPPSILGLVAVALVATLCGCSSDPAAGYSFDSSHQSAVRTVHVPIFQNPTFTRGIEVELTSAIVREIQTTTPWRIVGESAAQTSLSGTITESTLRKLSTGRDSGLAQEVSVVLTVDFDWKDNRSGKALVSRRNFVASEAFVPAQGVNERIEVGQHAAIQRMARDIVSELRSQW